MEQQIACGEQAETEAATGFLRDPYVKQVDDRGLPAHLVLTDQHESIGSGLLIYLYIP